jgi:hypothetical protein
VSVPGEGTSRPERERWAAGLPHAGDHLLEPHDATWVRRRLVALRRGLLAAALALVASAVVLALLPADLPAFDRIGGRGPAWLGAVGLLGVLGCLVLARGAWRVLAALGALYLSGMAAVGALHPQLHPRPQGIDAAVVLGMMVLGTSFLAVVLVGKVATWRRRGAIEADLQRGIVERYAGPATSPALRRLAAIAPGDPDFVRLDVLPAAQVVVRVNGRRLERWSPAHVATIAPARPHALRVGLPAELVPQSNDGRFTLERRSLSPEEREELGEHAARLRRRRGPVAAITIAVAAVSAWQLHGASSWRDAFDVVTLAWYVLLVLAWVGYARRLRAAHKLNCDEKLRWVVTVRDAGDRTAGAPPKLEVLPVSQLAWTEHARPAGWRVDAL